MKVDPKILDYFVVPPTEWIKIKWKYVPHDGLRYFINILYENGGIFVGEDNKRATITGKDRWIIPKKNWPKAEKEILAHIKTMEEDDSDA